MLTSREYVNMGKPQGKTEGKHWDTVRITTGGGLGQTLGKHRGNHEVYHRSTQRETNSEAMLTIENMPIILRVHSI